MCPSVDPSTCLLIDLSLYLATHLSIYLSMYSWILLSTCPSIYLLTCRSSRPRRQQNNAARLLLATSKTKQFCETFSLFAVENIKNEAILRDFLQKWKVDCTADGIVPMRFAIFPCHVSKVLAPATKKLVQVIRNAAPVTKKHLGIADDLIRQNATPLRKSAPWAPNISAEDASCTAPATKNASVQILFKSPTPAIVFENATKPSRFSHFSVDAQSTPPATQNERLWTSKMSPRPSVFNTFDFEMCFALDISTSKSAPRPPVF